MKDWLGHQYGVGDMVIYPAGSGRSITMVVGKVIDIYQVYYHYEWVRLKWGESPPFRRVWNRDTTAYEDSDERMEAVTRVQVEPLGSSRWKQHHGRDSYIDKRTGKHIDPYKGTKHIAVEGHYIDTRDGHRIPDGDQHKFLHGRAVYPYEHTKYVSTVFQPWVEKVHTPTKKVTILNIDNITKWDGEVPSGLNS